MDMASFFKHEVKPALGCTEPAAVALAASAAARRLTGPPKHIHLRLSANVFKNGQNVGIPGASGLRGNQLAAALGALAGDPAKGLQALEDVTESDLLAARRLLEDGHVTQEILRDAPSVYAEVEVLRQGESAVAVVADRHDQVAEIRVGGKVVERAENAEAARGMLPAYLRDLGGLTFDSIWDLSGSIEPDIEDFLLSGAAMNLAMASQGLERPWGLGLGPALAGLRDMTDPCDKARVLTAAAADARMGGLSQAVMSSAGSGNHGLTAVIPPAVMAQEMDAPARTLAEALALSHLVTGAIKVKAGRLSPVCGCAVAAGAGAAAACARLLGGNVEDAQRAVANLLSAVLGMVCDGGKPGCAFKAATAAAEAVLAAQLALQGAGVEAPEGVIAKDFTINANAVGELSAVGFAAADGVILRLMDVACS